MDVATVEPLIRACYAASVEDNCDAGFPVALTVPGAGVAQVFSAKVILMPGRARFERLPAMHPDVRSDSAAAHPSAIELWVDGRCVAGPTNTAIATDIAACFADDPGADHRIEGHCGTLGCLTLSVVIERMERNPLQ